MAVKDFLKEWKPKALKEMSKDDRTALLYDYLPELVQFYVKKGHNRVDEVNQLFDRMQNRKFAKTLLRILKTPEHSPVDLALATLIYDFMERRHQNLDEELMGLYTEAVDKILKKRVKKLSKKLGLSKDLLKELLVVVAEPDAISDPKFVGIYVHRMLRKLYALAKDNDLGLENVKSVRKLFKALFGEELLNHIAVNVLLERKEHLRNYNENQQAVWNLLTDFALETLEENKKSEIRELLEMYVQRRAKDAEKQRDAARRIQFASISEEDYPKIYAAYEKLSKKEKYAQYL